VSAPVTVETLLEEMAALHRDLTIAINSRSRAVNSSQEASMIRAKSTRAACTACGEKHALGAVAVTIGEITTVLGVRKIRRDCDPGQAVAARRLCVHAR
jgi:hypothetical protein